MTIVPFKNWILTVDHDYTKSIYATINNGSAEDCSCEECLNYLQLRDVAFPHEIRPLFAELGVDYRKESEVWRMCKELNGYHRYSVIFHFKGSFDGADCIVHTKSGYDTALLEPVTANFCIGFTMANDLACFKDKEGLVQIEVETKIPWVINRLESEW